MAAPDKSKPPRVEVEVDWDHIVFAARATPEERAKMTNDQARALLSALSDGGHHLTPERTLFSKVNDRCGVPITWTEFRQLLVEAEEKHRILCVPTEDGPKWMITANGRGRLAELS